LLILESIILGIIQGLTEFIPVSSSAHLLTIPKLFGWKDLGLAFDVALHLGTLVAVGLYFRKDWLAILGSFARRVFKRVPYSSDPDPAKSGRLLVPIIIACIPAAVVGKLFEDKIDALRDEPWALFGIAGVLVVISGVMFAAERLGTKLRSTGQMNYVDFILIGFAQALALFPGVSRSGITISTGLFRNLDREAAARFSFLLSTPIIFGAGVLKLKDAFEVGLPADQVALFGIGMVTAAVSGYLAIHFLMNYLKNRTLNAFVVYRLCFAALLVVVALVR